MKLLSLSKQFIISLLLIFLLAACDGNDSWCLTTDKNAYNGAGTITNVSNMVTQVNADGSDPNNVGTLGRWISSGVSILQGDVIALSATGTILTSTPYGLLPSITSSNNIAGFAGDPTKTDQMAAYNAMLSGTSTTSYYDNGGLGTKFIFAANATASTLINIPGTATPFPFTAGQNITVTTKSCGVGDTSSAEPTKWTWNNNWKYVTVRCDYKGHSRSFTANNTGDCKAITNCNNDSPEVDKRYQSWRCHMNVPVSQNFVSTPTADFPSTTDSCSSYNCQSNETQTGSCYAATGYAKGDGDWCGGT